MLVLNEMKREEESITKMPSRGIKWLLNNSSYVNFILSEVKKSHKNNDKGKHP